MIGPIQGPDTPKDWGDDRVDEPGFKGNGAKLFRKVSDLYFFCMAKDVVAPSDRFIYTTLSKIMQISKHSATFGDYINDNIENSASEMISELKESLKSGKVPRQAISTKLEHILSVLVDDNRKARLMVTLTELEIYFMSPAAGATEEEKRTFYERVTRVIEKLTPETADINAEAINRDLRHFLHGKHEPSKILEDLSLCYERWLK